MFTQRFFCTTALAALTALAGMAAPAAAFQAGSQKPAPPKKGAPQGEPARSDKDRAPAEAPVSGRPLKPGELYRLRPGDEIAVDVEPQREYSTAGLILPDGRLILKNLKPLDAAGRTLDEITQIIRKELNTYLVDPRVEVTIRRLAPFEPPAPDPADIPPPPGTITVTGAVQRGGPQELPQGIAAQQRPLRVMKAIELAGGVTPNADLSRVEIRHADLTGALVDLATRERQLDPKFNVVLQDGDSVVIPLVPDKATPYVRILGEVISPSRYELKPAMTVEDLILQSGKLTQLADLENVQLQRRDGSVQKLDLIEQQKRGLQGIVYLEEGDIVHIPQFDDRMLLVGAIPGAGPRKIEEGMTLYEFFKRGTPETLTALNNAIVDLDSAQLFRQGDPPRKIDLKDVLGKPESKDNVTLQNGDILFVPARNEKQKSSILSYLPLAFLFAGI